MLLSETTGGLRGQPEAASLGNFEVFGGSGTLSPGRQCGDGARVKNDWDFN